MDWEQMAKGHFETIDTDGTGRRHVLPPYVLAKPVANAKTSRTPSSLFPVENEHATGMTTHSKLRASPVLQWINTASDEHLDLERLCLIRGGYTWDLALFAAIQWPLIFLLGARRFRWTEVPRGGMSESHARQNLG